MDEARTISAADWGARKAALHQAAQAHRGTIQDRLLGPMESWVANSFTEAQLLELERILAAPASSRLPIDLRLTVRFFRRRFFLTFLAGTERRSAERLKEERAKHRLWTLANVSFLIFLLVLFVPTVIGLVHIFAIGN